MVLELPILGIPVGVLTVSSFLASLFLSSYLGHNSWTDPLEWVCCSWMEGCWLSCIEGFLPFVLLMVLSSCFVERGIVGCSY